jgi:hypothetical protein
MIARQALKAERRMHDVSELVDGYRRFVATRYPEQAGLYRRRADDMAAVSGARYAGLLWVRPRSG